MEKGTIIRTVVLAIALINQVAGTSIVALSESDVVTIVDAIYLVVSTVATLVSSIVAWWKNNSFTKQAQRADKVLHNLKGMKE